MRRAALAAVASLFALSACGAETADQNAPDAAQTASESDLERLDRLWSDVFTTKAELRLQETLLVLDCLEARGFTVHNVQDMTSAWNRAGLPPSQALEEELESGGLPTPEEAETRAFGYWLSFADAYEDQEGVDLSEAERAAEDEEAPEEPAALVDLSDLEPYGEGWDQQSAVEQMRWEIAYEGTDWAQSSKSASLLSDDEWDEVGIPDGEWRQASELESAPEGCQGDVHTGLYGEPERVEPMPGFVSWEWGPRLDFEPLMPGAAEEVATAAADLLLACVADAGYEQASITETGGFDLGEGLHDRYLPEAAVTEGDRTSYNYSDITEADRERYEQTKNEEFEAAAAVAACDTESGYTEAFAEEFAQQRVGRLIAAIPDYEAYLAELQAALEALAES